MTEEENLVSELESLDKSKEEEFSTSRDENFIEHALRWEKYLSRKQDRQQRKEFASKIFIFLCVYMVVVFVLLLFSGIKGQGLCFHLDDKVLLALLTTTTINMISIFVVVAKYLFPNKRK